MGRLIGLGLLVLVGCGGDAGTDGDAPADTLTRAQKDSIVAESGLPGSAGVGRAMEAVQDANARSAAHDSLLQ